MLAEFLLQYRNTEHATTQRTPSELLTGRRGRLRLDSIFTDFSAESRAHQDEALAEGGNVRQFSVGDTVWARDFRGQDKWIPAVVVTAGSRNYEIDIGGARWKRHTNQLRHRLGSALENTTEQTTVTFSTPERRYSTRIR